MENSTFMTAIVINSIVVLLLIISFVKDRKKTVEAIKIGMISLLKLMPVLISITLMIGLLMGFVSPDMISKVIGENSGFKGVITSSLFGSVLHIPSIVAFPLSASLIERGASIMSVAAFITTLTMIGFVTLPLEIKELGKRFALLRTTFSFVAAICVAIIMGLIL